MRICFIALGMFTHIDAYLDYFAEQGHEVHFIALTPGPQRRVSMHSVCSRDGFLKLPGKWGYLPAMLRARRVVRSLAPDIVHAQYATSAGLAAFVCNVHPWVVTAHGTDVTLGVRSPVWRILLRLICRSADCVNAVSDDLRKMILGLGTPAKKIDTFTLGIDTKLFRFSQRNFPNPGAPLRLICTRGLERVYDHTTIIQSMAILRQQGVNFSLTVVGNGSLGPNLKKLAAEQGVIDRITFAGAVTNAALPSFLDAHDIYLSASTRDGTSLSLLEAMASGLYPIVSNIKANTEWIKHGHNGRLHKVSDARNLADCILEFMQDSGATGQALHFNRKLVEERGDRTKNMKHLEEVYSKLVVNASIEPDVEALVRSDS